MEPDRRESGAEILESVPKPPVDLKSPALRRMRGTTTKAYRRVRRGGVTTQPPKCGLSRRPGFILAGSEARRASILGKEICGLYLAGRMEKRDLLTLPDRVVNFARMKLAGLPHEAFMAIFLNTQNEIIGHEIVNEGTVDQVAA